MYTRMIPLAAFLSLVSLVTPQLCSEDFSILRSDDPVTDAEIADDIDQSENDDILVLDLPTTTGVQESAADRPTLPSPLKMSRTNQVPVRRVVEPTNPDEPQPLMDPDPLQLPEPSRTQLPTSTPVPISAGSPADISPARATTRQPSETEDAIPVEMNTTTAVPILSVETQSPAEINVGKTAQYAIDVKNHGEVTAENVQIYATLPERVKLIEADPQPTMEVDGEVRFDVGNLGSKQGCLIKLKLVPREMGQVELAARASFSISASSAMQVRRPQLMLTCDGPDEANYGDTVTFNLVVTNVGDGVADDVVILPQMSTQSATETNSKQSLPIGWLRPGASRKIPYTASAVGPGKLEARFIATDASGSETTATAQIRVRRAMVEVAVRGPEVNFMGREDVYEVCVSNPGDAATKNVKVVASLPAALQLTVLGRPAKFDRRANTLTWFLERLSPGAVDTLAFKLKATEEGQHVQEVTASAEGGLYADDRLATQVIGRPHINVRVINRDGPLAVDTAAEFAVELKNVGTKTADNVRIKVITPDALEAVASDDYAAQSNELAFAPLSLAVGESKTLRFRTVGREAGDHMVRVVLESNSLSRPLAVEGSAFFYKTKRQPRVSRLDSVTP
jgi:uncharacterized repeat protein (TIGR01451 family)